jgi:hypothetical protein
MAKIVLKNVKTCPKQKKMAKFPKIRNGSKLGGSTFPKKL